MNYCVKDYANGEILKEEKRNFKRREQRNDYNYKKGDKNNELYNLFSITGKNILPPFLMALIIEFFLDL